MFRAVLWKEWREQAAVVVALLVLGGGVLTAVVQLGGEPYRAESALYALLGTRAGIAFVMLAVTAGVTIGGTLFAGETEAGTATFLHALPPTRGRHWRAKIASGLLLTVGAGTVLIGEGLAAGVVSNEAVAAPAAALNGMLILAAFAWGTVGSVLGRTTLAACGIGLLSAVAAIFIAIVFGATVNEIFLTLLNGSRHDANAAAFLLTLVLWVFGPLPLSWLLYVAPDWSRDAAAPLVEPVGRKRRRSVRPALGGRSRWGVVALVWLMFRQWVVPVSILGSTSLALGLTMLAEPVPMLAAWPVVTLVVGALIGTIGWADEQGRGSARYWGERRLPATRLWLAKVSAGLALTLGLSVLFLLPSVIRAAVNSKEATAAAIPFPLLLIGGRSLFTAAFFTLLWPVYGFVAGHLAGLLFRKTIVAFAVAVLAGGVVAGLWFPSVYAGGLHIWQFAATPLVVVVTARLLMRSWAADRLAEPRAVIVLAAGLVVAFAATAAGLAWRVVEVPVIPESEDDIKFAKSIPTLDQNPAGQEIRAGLTKLQGIPGEVKRREATTWIFPGVEPDAGLGSQRTFHMQIHEVLTRGYPADRPDLDAWMDDMFADGWDEPILAAAGKPLGVVENVNDMDYYAWSPLAQELRTAVVLMLARGLQKQVHGDPAAYPRYLDATLAASRNMRNKSVAICALIGIAVEQVALSSVSAWLQKLGDRPDLLRAVGNVLARHEKANPVDLRENVLADVTLVRGSVNNPAKWAAKALKYEESDRRSGLRQDRTDAEVEMIGFAWAVPWERERLNRLVGLCNAAGRDAEIEALARGGPPFFGADRFGQNWLTQLRKHEADREAARRAAKLLVALRLFQAETGKPASGLGQLVPKYLAAVPADPFDAKPFRYRLSAGEWVEMEEVETQYPTTVIGPGAITLPEFYPPEAAGGVPNPVLTQKQFDAVAAVGSGLVRYPKPLPGPPGLEEFGEIASPDGGPLNYTEFGLDLVGSVAGGVVQWPLPPIAASGPGEDGNPGFIVRESNDRRRQRVEPGQGVLWSVGPDLSDDGGKAVVTRRGPSSSGEDLIWIVPPPAIP